MRARYHVAMICSAQCCVATGECERGQVWVMNGTPSIEIAGRFSSALPPATEVCGAIMLLDGRAARGDCLHRQVCWWWRVLRAIRRGIDCAQHQRAGWGTCGSPFVLLPNTVTSGHTGSIAWWLRAPLLLQKDDWNAWMSAGRTDLDVPSSRAGRGERTHRPTAGRRICSQVRANLRWSRTASRHPQRSDEAVLLERIRARV